MGGRGGGGKAGGGRGKGGGVKITGHVGTEGHQVLETRDSLGAAGSGQRRRPHLSADIKHKPDVPTNPAECL